MEKCQFGTSSCALPHIWRAVLRFALCIGPRIDMYNCCGDRSFIVPYCTDLYPHFLSFLRFFVFFFRVYSDLFPIFLLFFRFSLCTFARALQANGLCPLPTLDKTRCAALSSCVGVLLPWNLCTWLTRSRQSSSSLSLPARASPITGLWSPMGS